MSASWNASKVTIASESGAGLRCLQLPQDTDRFFFSRDTVFFWFSLVPYETWQLQLYGDPCKPPANLLLSLVPMAHPLSFTLNFSLTNLQTQTREINYTKPWLQLQSRTVPLLLNTSVWTQVAILWHRKNMISIQCKVLGGCIFLSVCNLRVKQRVRCSHGWCLCASQGQSHLSPWFS